MKYSLGFEGKSGSAEIILLKRRTINAINLSGKVEIKTLHALLKKCLLFIGNDSGLMHLSAAANINRLGLFGPSKEINYRPWGDKSYFLRTESNYEDLVNVKGYSRHHSSSLMKTLTVEKVLRKCSENLSQ